MGEPEQKDNVVGEKNMKYGEILDDIKSEELRIMLIQFATRLSTVKPGAPDHPDKIKEVGNYWRTQRKLIGCSRQYVANEIGVPENRLAYFEQGLVSLEEMEDIVESLGKVFGNPGDLKAISQTGELEKH